MVTGKWDCVEVSFGSEEQKYCGSNKPSPIISTDNTMTVVFHSDSIISSGEIKSPNYPAVYPHNLDEVREGFSYKMSVVIIEKSVPINIWLIKYF